MAAERGLVRAELGAKRVRAFLDGRVVVDTVRPLLVWEVPYYPTYYLPLDDMVAELSPTGEVNHSPSRGDAEVHDIVVGESVAKAAALVYRGSPIEDLRGHVRLDLDSGFAWFEEDEEVYGHPRSPYSRIDILPSSRHVEVRLGDVVLAESNKPHVLFETGLPPRWYVPRVDVHMDLLVPSDTVTRCPYKGQAAHLSARIADEVTPDVAWSYPTPLPESERIANLVSFYPDRVEVLVDGEPATTVAHRPRP